MQRSETLTALLPALLKAQAALKAPKKTATNPHFNSRYAPLEEVLGAVLPALHANDLVLLQPVTCDQLGTKITTLIMHKSGEWIAADLSFDVPRSSAQAVGSAITYGRRYGLALVGVVAEEDDDGTAATSPAPTVTGTARLDNGVQAQAMPDDGVLRVVGVEYRPTKNPNVRRATVTLSDGRRLSTINQGLAQKCEELVRNHTALIGVDAKDTKWGLDLIAVQVETTAETAEAFTDDTDIPF